MYDIKSQDYKLNILFVGIFYFAIRFFYEALQSTLTAGKNLWSISIMVTMILFILGFYSEFKMTRINTLNLEPFSLSTTHMKSTGIIILNTITVYLLATQFSISSILAASVSCLLFTILFSNYEPEAYTGALTGMVGLYLCQSWPIAIGIGLVSSLIFILFIPYFNGIGGRGGTIPFIATLITVRLFLSLSPENLSPIDQEHIMPSLLMILFTAFMTYSLHYHRILSPVKSGMLVTFVFSVLLPQHHSALVTAMFLGTILGMSSPDRYKHALHLLVIGLFAFILFVPSFHLLDGVGGKLGFLSFIAYLASIGEKTVRLYLKQKMMDRRKSSINTRRKMT